MNDITVPVNLIAVFSAAVASMSVGYLWYGPLFGKLWMKEMGMKGTMSEAAILGMAKSYAIMFVGSLVMAYVLAHAIFFASTYLNMTGLPAGIMSGFWNWLGLSPQSPWDRCSGKEKAGNSGSSITATGS